MSHQQNQETRVRIQAERHRDPPRIRRRPHAGSVAKSAMSVIELMEQFRKSAVYQRLPSHQRSAWSFPDCAAKLAIREAYRKAHPSSTFNLPCNKGFRTPATRAQQLRQIKAQERVPTNMSTGHSLRSTLFNTSTVPIHVPQHWLDVLRKSREAQRMQAKPKPRAQHDTGARTSNAKPEQSRTDRCWTCDRNIGLIGIQCRCGYFLCSEHRYSDRHNCTYDYKEVGKRQITEENPWVGPCKRRCH